MRTLAAAFLLAFLATTSAFAKPRPASADRPKVVKHYDSKGNATGKSVATTTWTGKPVVKHYDSKGNATGKSVATTTWTGKPVVKHYDSKGKVRGKSR
jgi:hypothetical protein